MKKFFPKVKKSIQDHSQEQVLEVWINNTFLKGKRPFFWIFFLGFLVYSVSIFFGLTYLDDQVLLMEKREFINNFSNISKIFNKDVFMNANGGSYYRPIMLLSLFFDAIILKSGYGVFHFTNILIHIFTVFLSFSILIKLGTKKKNAFFLSILYLVHPVLVQAVVWIPGRNDSLLALFVLLAFNFFLNFSKNYNFKNLLFCLIAFFLAVFTKETAIIFPFVCIIYYLLQKKKVFSLNLFCVVFGCFLIVIFWYIKRKSVISGLSSDLFDLIFQTLKDMPGILSYLQKLIFPIGLSTYPAISDLNWHLGVIIFPVYIYILILAIKEKNKLMILGFCWVILFILPSLVNVDANKQAVFLEHRLYTSFFGILLIFSGLFRKVYSCKINNLLKFLFSFLIILIFSFLSFIHALNFQNKFVFWRQAVATSPKSAFAINNLAAMYIQEKDYTEAEILWKKALKINPKEPLVHNNLGLLAFYKKDYERAETFYLQELKINPNFSFVNFNLANLYFQKGEYLKAKEYMEIFLKMKPENKEGKKFLDVINQKIKS